MKKNVEALWQDDQHWKLGSIYYCEDDPRIIVAKRRRWAGWTFNFAHRASIILLILIILILGAPINYILHTNQEYLLPYAIGASVLGTLLVSLLFARIGRD